MQVPPAEQRAAIRVEGLTVDRGGRRVLTDLGCTVGAGTVTGLLGPSGCGKSTLMRAVVGVQVVAGGTIEVIGRPAGHPELRSRVGYVTQAPSVYGDLTVAQNVGYFAAVAGAGAEAARSAVARVGLADAAGRMVGALSGGQRSRVSLACALIGDPEVLVLDEPTVGLDPVIRAELWDFFHALAADGTTLLVSSHVMDEAARCDRLLLMRDGDLIADDGPDAIRAGTGTDGLGEAFLRLIRRREATSA